MSRVEGLNGVPLESWGLTGRGQQLFIVTKGGDALQLNLRWDRGGFLVGVAADLSRLWRRPPCDEVAGVRHGGHGHERADGQRSGEQTATAKRRASSRTAGATPDEGLNQRLH